VLLAGAVLMFVPNTVALPLPLPQALLIAAAFTAVMVIFEFIDHHSHTAFGLWLTLIGALVAAYGAFEMGGRVRVPTGPTAP
jgi:undecaprenyl pyrophosphate phosphatase UppP